MNAKELRAKSRDELNTELFNSLKEYFNLRMQRGMGEQPRSHMFKRVRKNIARVKTILNEEN